MSGENLKELEVYLCSSFQVQVERPWDLEELQNVTAALLDPEKGIERFIGAVTNVEWNVLKKFT